MVDAVNSKEFTDHKLPTGQIKHGNRVAERVKRARRGLTKTHSVASEAVRFAFQVCIAFRVRKTNTETGTPSPKGKRAGNPLHLDNCTKSDSI